MIRLKKIIQLKEQEQPSSHLTAKDISYFKEQIANMLTSLDEMHQEIGTNIQMANDETGYDIYKEMDAQISRYIESSKKSLEYCDKYLTRIAPRLERL
jgi:hypothetical protein